MKMNTANRSGDNFASFERSALKRMAAGLNHSYESFAASWFEGRA